MTTQLLKTRKQLADEIGVCRKTLYNKIKQAGLCLDRDLLTPKEQKQIYRLFGKKKTKIKIKYDEK